MQINITTTFQLTREFDVPDDTLVGDLVETIKLKIKELEQTFTYTKSSLERSSFEWRGTEVTNFDDEMLFEVRAPYEEEITHVK
jgi:hypothetical protein